MPTFVTSDGVEIRYEQRGEGPPVFVCQGGPNNICDTLIADLEPLETSCRLVFHDYRGSGQSATADPETYRFDRLADDLDELRQHLGRDEIAVLAHSMGGFIALEFVRRHPEACSRLALVGVTPCGATGPMALPTLRALGLARTIRGLGMALRFVVLWSWRKPSKEKTEALYAPMSVTQEPRRALRAVVKAAHPEVPVDNDNSERLMKALSSVDLRPDLAGMACPVLVMYGSRDSVMVAGGKMLERGLHHPEIHVLPNVGHEPFLEEPEPTFAALRPFLEG
jgi:pimeloyl-ACP methyl ester carboxylesterase